MKTIEINKGWALCEDEQCETHQLHLWLDKGPYVVVEYQEPLTPWKYNFYEVLRLDKQSVENLIDGLQAIYEQMA